MKLKVLLALAIVLAVVATEAAVLRDDGDNSKPGRQKRTLGLLTTGAQAVGTGISSAGRVAATAVGIISAIKPLILLGIGKYALYNWLSRNGYLSSNPVVSSSGADQIRGPGLGFNVGASGLGLNLGANLGLGQQPYRYNPYSPYDDPYNAAPFDPEWSSIPQGPSYQAADTTWSKKRR